MAEAVQPESSEESFEAELEKLGAAVERLEGGDLSLDVALQCFEEGIGSLRRCYSVLERAQKRIETLCAEVESASSEGEVGDGAAGETRWKRAELDVDQGGKSLPGLGIGESRERMSYADDFAGSDERGPSESD